MLHVIGAHIVIRVAKYVLVLVGIVFSPPSVSSFSVSAHSGGLNADGCHNNRKTGDYHCHGGGTPKPKADTSRQSRDAGRSSLKSNRSGSFSNCSEARAAGAAPVRRGDPGYGTHLDRDNDGIGCE